MEHFADSEKKNFTITAFVFGKSDPKNGNLV